MISSWLNRIANLSLLYNLIPSSATFKTLRIRSVWWSMKKCRSNVRHATSFRAADTTSDRHSSLQQWLNHYRRRRERRYHWWRGLKYVHSSRATRRPEIPTEAFLSDHMDIKSATLYHWFVSLISRASSWISAESHISLMIIVRILSVSKRVKRESVSVWRASVSVVEYFSPRKKKSIPRLRAHEVNKDNDNTEICKYDHSCNRDYPTLDTHFWTISVTSSYYFSQSKYC